MTPDDLTGPASVHQAIGQRLAANLLRNLDDEVRRMLTTAAPRAEVPDPPTLADLQEAARVIDEHRLTVVASPIDAARLEVMVAGLPFPPIVTAHADIDPGTAYVIAPETLRRPFTPDTADSVFRIDDIGT